MSLLSHTKLVELVEAGMINAPLENISGASIDITLDSTILIERVHTQPIMLSDKENLKMLSVDISDESYVIEPGEFILASSAEIFNLPANVAAEYKLKSSLARCGLNHMLAGWCDPSWNNSKLTLELKNETAYHHLALEAGMKIGQIVFWECDPVPEEHSYAKKGQYNNQEQVTQSKGSK